MGVHGLWELLAPVGRRVSVETLAGKRLAIDASIWMIQFMKAMREEKGEMVRNAHLLGFFRRICKLMYLRTKPVFVFDGGTPALKRRTVIARRRQRENAQAKIRKTAEKLLLNHLKAMRLKELAEDIENQRKTNDSKGKSVVSEDTITVQDMPEGNGFSTNIEKQQNRDDLKGKKVVLEDTDALEDILQGDGLAAKSFNNQEEIDEMLAASLAAEDDESFFPDASTSGAGPAKDEDDDEDEEMILPEMQGKIDPSILASLPPSMQLDLLVQMRERLMAENRQKYQKVKKAPEKFSELQIQAYLKTVAFRREIDEVQKSASGKGIGGVKISRIASEANREFIFSSSFTGDKQVLTSAGENQNKNNQMETSRENNSASMVSDFAAQKSSVVLESFVDEPEKDFHDDVETYLDERGRVRVSRSRAMGIRMTRDLQRNLDLMKEIEQERVVQYEDACNLPTVPTFSSENANAYGNACEKIQNLNSSHIDHEGMTCDKVENAESLLKSGTSLEISFEDKQEHNCGDDDDLFASLVGGDPIIDFSVNDSPVKKQSTDSASDVDWEEGVTEEKFGMLSSNFPGESEPSLTGGGGLNDESEVVWEEGPSDIHKGAFLCPSEGRNASKGDFEEEADFQEAIRRSLQDLKDQRSVEESSPDDLSRKVSGEGNMATIIESDLQEKYWSKPKLSENEILHQPDILSKATTHFKTNDATDGLEIAEVNNCLNTHLGSEFRDNLGQGKILNGKVCSDTADTNNGLETHLTPPIRDSPRQGEILTGSTHSESHLQDLGGSGNLNSKILEETCIDVEGIGEHMIEVQGIDTINEVAEGNDNSSGATLLFARLDSRLPDSSLSDAQEKGFEAASDDHACDITELGKTCPSIPITDTYNAQRINKEPEHDDGVGKREESFGTPVVRSIQKDHLEFTAESLVEEMLILGEERKELGDEQRRLERNAESVTSEMFSECQELLQMFGLPYIIAPMEAEAQCAYMELVNLVDGVVTDDSDAFLFGARSVYKNIFDDRKYVETYLMKDVENELGLDREKLIRMAMLLGSDYTEGVSGIGIVNAIEVLNAFPEEDGLHKFREWVESPDPTILGKIDGRSHAHHGNDGCILQSVDEGQKIKQIFMDKHRNVSKNWHIPSSFPSDAVVSAYDTPQVDKSTEPFSWGKPDVSVLRKLCWEKFGWTVQKTDELLTPVLKEYNKHETQLRLEAFYAFNERFAKIRSKRIKKALKGMTGNCSLELMDDAAEDMHARRMKQKVNPNDEKGTNLETDSVGVQPAGGDEIKTAKKSSGKQSRKSKGERLQSGGAAKRLKGSKESNARRRPKGQERTISVGKERKRKNSCSRSNETSSSTDKTNSDEEQETETEKLEVSQVRRSERPRKVVSYTDLEDDDHNKVEHSFSEEPMKRELVQDPSYGQGSPGDLGKINEDVFKGDSGEEFLMASLEPGGFGMDGTGMESVSAELVCSDDNNPLSGDQLSKDYLMCGGGFCLEEDDANTELGDLAPGTIPEENSDFSHQSSIQEEDLETDLDQLDSNQLNKEETMRASETEPYLNEDSPKPKVAIPQENIVEDDLITGSVKSLRAMPNLKKKRRKV
nr:DNA repair protein UVH3 isoform X1 [Ipomoea batatas]